MATSTIPNPNEKVTITLIVNGDAASGSGTITVCGGVATISAVINNSVTGTNLKLAWMPGCGGDTPSGDYVKYLPSENVWLSCDAYDSNISKAAEVKMQSNGHLVFNIPAG